MYSLCNQFGLCAIRFYFVFCVLIHIRQAQFDWISKFKQIATQINFIDYSFFKLINCMFRLDELRSIYLIKSSKKKFRIAESCIRNAIYFEKKKNSFIFKDRWRQHRLFWRIIHVYIFRSQIGEIEDCYNLRTENLVQSSRRLNFIRKSLDSEKIK